MNQRLPGRNWSPTIVRPEPPRDLDPMTFRLQALHKDAEDLSALSAVLQSDLQNLRKGVLSKDFADHLKRIEKLSKKLRQEVAH